MPTYNNKSYGPILLCHIPSVLVTSVVSTLAVYGPESDMGNLDRIVCSDNIAKHNHGACIESVDKCTPVMFNNNDGDHNPCKVGINTSNWTDSPIETDAAHKNSTGPWASVVSRHDKVHENAGLNLNLPANGNDVCLGSAVNDLCSVGAIGDNAGNGSLYSSNHV